MSINGVAHIRELFGRFDIEPVDLVYGVGGGARPAKELGHCHQGVWPPARSKDRVW
ncbi:hypothetical protein [Mesorhizobium sp. ES1-6]|uniref:hypothetical protein n=1 Tax=Mesorhizobium sp. ES1-6 TaxID=2876626 RepID=UPI001CCBA945|nr:hypothetical protein [Mesorhizobium sp. ES1-6]MBZ9806241.1 hypothetical protein [Mesorhizobium sp. ES1-6]